MHSSSAALIEWKARRTLNFSADAPGGLVFAARLPDVAVGAAIVSYLLAFGMPDRSLTCL
jgi:hypothetical protein